MQILKSDIELGEITQNIALMLESNATQFADMIAYREKKEGVYQGITWSKLYNDILNISFNLKSSGFKKRDKMVIFSPNRLEMLELELAIMASGGVAVPIFAYFYQETAELLIKHSDAKYLAVAGSTQLSRLSPTLPLERIYSFEPVSDTRFTNLHSFSELLKERTENNYHLDVDAHGAAVCLNMYTSGTMGIPKCVQLTHANILSQQAALKKVWDVSHKDRFLSYLPWHHSFGGIFELFSALYNGATYSLESGYGKDTSVIFENWKLIKPTVFFSVPKVYQSLVEQTHANPEAENLLFHSGLKFIFTAAAALPEKISDEFENRGIPVIEGWGLTETSPCCTLTNPKVKREPGVVGNPIPGVQIRLGDEDEIQVLGPNVMLQYYKNDEANKDIFTLDGWFKTGDVGEFTKTGLKLISRKDRIFKLTNGEKVIPSDIEKAIEKKCHFVSFAVVTGGGKEFPVALIFPNRKMLNSPEYETSPMDGCFCPRNLNELGRCLTGCLHDANCGIGQKFAKVKAAMIIDDELSIEKNTITPSLKIAPNNVLRAYKANIENLYGEKNVIHENVYVIRLDNHNPK